MKASKSTNSRPASDKPGCAPSGLLDRFRSKSCNPSAVTVFWEIDNTRTKLAEMDDYPGVIPVVVEALKRKGVRVDESCFKHPDISNPNKYIMVLRGEAGRILDPLFEREPCSLAREQVGQGYLRRLHLRLASFIRRRCGHSKLGGSHDAVCAIWSNDRTDRRGRPVTSELETGAARPRSVQ